MVLIVDEKVQGYKKEFSKLNDLKTVIVALIDENVEMVTIKKRVADGNPQSADTKGVL